MNNQLNEIHQTLKETLAQLNKFLQDFKIIEEVKEQRHLLGEKQKHFLQLLEEKDKFEKAKQELSQEIVITNRQKEENRIQKMQLNQLEKNLKDKQNQIQRILGN